MPPALKQRDRDTLRRIQMIYQMPDTAVNPRHTVRDVIGRPLEFYLGLSGEAQDRCIGELLDLIELDDSFIDRLPGELSGGQKLKSRGGSGSPSGWPAASTIRAVRTRSSTASPT